MENLDCNQIKIFINLEIIGEEEKNQKYIYIFLIIKRLKIFLQLGTTICCNYGY